MPTVRKAQATLVHGRVQRSQRASTLPSSSAAMAKANGTEKPAQPTYCIGGWMIMPGSCSSGLRSWPSAAAGSRRMKGLEVKIRKATKPKPTMPSTPSTRATTGCGSRRENSATAAFQQARISVHSSSEPSWEPQTAV